MNSKSSQIPCDDFTDLTNYPHQTHILVKMCDINVSHLRAEAATDRQQSRKHQKNAAKYYFKHGVFLENKAAARADFQCVSHRLAGTLLASSDTFLCALFFPSASPLSPLPGCFTSHHLKGLHGRQHRSEFKRLNIVHWEVAEKQMSRGSLWRR